MILETLRAMILAGKDALQTTCGLEVTGEYISQIRTGELTFPALGELTVTGGPVQTIHLGCDNLLAGHLAELVSESGQETGIGTLASRFLQQLLEELPGRNPTGQISCLEVGPITVRTRGVRSFGFRLETGKGQLYFMAELPSRLEMELAKGTDYLASMGRTYMPKGWLDRSHISNKSDIESCLVFLRKTECDLQLDIPDGEGTVNLHQGFMVEQCSYNDRRGLKLSLDLAEPGASVLRQGEKVTGMVGFEGRALEFVTEYLGRSKHPVFGEAKLNTLVFAIPEELRVVQKRQTFRIETPRKIKVKLVGRGDVNPGGDFMGLAAELPTAKGQLADLSFSGLRVFGELNVLSSLFGSGQQVDCVLKFPDEDKPITVVGIVRRSTSLLTDRNSWQDDLGIEFMVSPEVDPAPLQLIREYILKEQRLKLAERVHVSGNKKQPS